MAILLSLFLFLILMAAIGYFGYRRYARPGRVYEQLGGEATFSTPMVSHMDAGDGMVVKVMQQLGEQVPIDPADASLLRRDLMAAGYRSEQALFVYQATRVLAIVVLVVLALIFRGYITSNGILSIVIPIGAGLLGYFIPSLILDNMVSNRHERIRMALPDALDLMVVSVEAGLGLDQAIQYVAKELVVTHPDISQELQLVNLEIFGPASAAWKSPAKPGGTNRRSRAPETGRHPDPDRAVRNQYCRLLAVRTPTSCGFAVNQSQAEERANKGRREARLLRIFFFILPAMLVVSAGPRFSCTGILIPVPAR